MARETLKQWDVGTRKHLNDIRYGADLIKRHVNQLVHRPNFETEAEADMADIEAVLVIALATVKEARAKYQSTPHAED